MKWLKTLTLGAVLLSGAVMAKDQPTATATAILGGGCFWCVEADLAKLDGIIDVTSGYSGGSTLNPTYENYNKPPAGGTPHVEVVEVIYNPTILNYGGLIEYFLHHIDPTDGEGQFCDRGPAYRPVIFTSDPAEAQMARDKLMEAERQLKTPLKVQVLPVSDFWPAEEYHQDYAQKSPAKYKFYRWKCGRDARVDKVWSR